MVGCQRHIEDGERSNRKYENGMKTLKRKGSSDNQNFGKNFCVKFPPTVLLHEYSSPHACSDSTSAPHRPHNAVFHPCL